MPNIVIKYLCAICKKINSIQASTKVLRNFKGNNERQKRA